MAKKPEIPDTVPLVYALSDFPGADSRTCQAQKNIKAFRNAGINLVACDTGLHLGWYKAAAGDFDAQKAELSYVLDANPDARILLRLHVNPPYWWLRDHPEELIVYRTGQGDFPGTDNGESDRLIRGDAERQMRVSTASTLWRKEAGTRLRAFLESLRGTPEGSALFAVQIAYGIYGEWHQFGTDVGPAMQRYFQTFLREKYGNDETALRRAWHDNAVTFESAPFHPEPFQPADDGLFRDPRKSRYIMDAQECVQQNNAEAILYFCRIVKETLGAAVKAGTFYGYYFNVCEENPPIMGHLTPETLFHAKGTVDFLSGPAPYTENRKPEAVPMQRGLLESCRLNGLLWLTEMDQAPEDTLKYPYGGDPEKLETSVAVLRRNIWMPVLAGHGAWFYDHRVDFGNSGLYRKCGWWDNKALMSEIRSLRKAVVRHGKKPYRPAADVLFVYDTKQFFIRSAFTEQQYAVYSAVLRCGIAADTVYLQDLEKCDASRYRMFVFPNAYYLTPEQRDTVKRLTAGKQVVWLGAPGYCDGESLDCAGIREITGIRTERCGYADGYTTVPSLGGKKLSDQLPDGTPRFRITDPDAETLGTFENGAVCAARKGNQWYFASPLVDQGCMLPVVEASGAHRYCVSEGISVLADGSTVLLYTNNAGEKTLILRNGKKITKKLKAFTAWIVDAETGADLMQ